MELERRLDALEEQFVLLTAKQMATEAALGALSNFITRDPLLAEHVLQMASDQEAAAMQRDGIAGVLLGAFLAEIDAWQDRLKASSNTPQLIAK